MDGEIGMRGDLVAQEVQWWIRPRRQIVPAAELDRTQLWMIERVPIDERVLMMDVAPTQDRQRLVRRRTEIPEVVRLLASGHLVDDVPELGRPPEDTEVL